MGSYKAYIRCWADKRCTQNQPHMLLSPAPLKWYYSVFWMTLSSSQELVFVQICQISQYSRTNHLVTSGMPTEAEIFPNFLKYLSSCSPCKQRYPPPLFPSPLITQSCGTERLEESVAAFSSSWNPVPKCLQLFGHSSFEGSGAVWRHLCSGPCSLPKRPSHLSVQLCKIQ